MGFMALGTALMGLATAGGAYVSYDTAQDAKYEAKQERKRQDILKAEATREQAKTKEIQSAQQKRIDSKSKARKTRSNGGGGLLSGGDVGLMGQDKKQKLGA